MGQLSKDVKDLLIGNDGSDKEPDDFKTELQKAINKGIITKSDGTLLITSRMNADKLADEIVKRQEKAVTINVKDGKVFDSLEEELEYKKKKEEEEIKRKEKQAEIARQQLENSKKKSEKSVSKSNSLEKASNDREISDEKQ